MEQQFGAFTASELYCPSCRKSQPVRERLLLVLPTGELHDLVCRACGLSLGKRTVTNPTIEQPRGRQGPRSSRRQAR